MCVAPCCGRRCVGPTAPLRPDHSVSVEATTALKEPSGSRSNCDVESRTSTRTMRRMLLRPHGVDVSRPYMSTDSLVLQKRTFSRLVSDLPDRVLGLWSWFGSALGWSEPESDQRAISKLMPVIRGGGRPVEARVIP